MNILGNGGMQGGGLPPQLMQQIRQVKGLMQMTRGNPMALLQSNPQFAQVMQQFKGQNPQQVFESICKQQGIDGNAIINELKRQ